MPDAKKTNRYQAIGNSWAVPVVRWIGKRLTDYSNDSMSLDKKKDFLLGRITEVEGQGFFIDFGKDIVDIGAEYALNCTAIPESCEFKDISTIVSPDAPEDIYISPVGCYGIVRRKQERNLKINTRLEEVLLSISSQMSSEEIEKRSRIQKRGKFSVPTDNANPISESAADDQSRSENEDTKSLPILFTAQMTIFDFLNQ